MRLSLPPLPTTLQDRIISQELQYRQAQSNYFRTRGKVGDVVIPEVFLPVFEPAEATLAAIFVEPGAIHLVFHDEVGPEKTLDERYRVVRKEIYGRITDVESVEVVEGKAKFINNSSLVNLYETSMHYSTIEMYQGRIYSSTWNHMLSASPHWFIDIRGGYDRIEVEVREGDREAAEQRGWA